MPKQELEFFDANELEWDPIGPGLSERILSRDEETGDYTRLLNFAPGTNTSPNGVQRHDFWEEVLIVDGSIHDLTLNKTFTKGMYACRPPGMPHGPWMSQNGCITFEVRYYKS
ncbi:MAG: cupin domain-containing protein [Chloroflexi bacterium]|nr:cupin domain-containing protein [Chloroflexota bacterium]MDA8187293.1 cupin domain-containing protein [Dehalococcoidales bacterium]